jgi:hypothetical protein
MKGISGLSFVVLAVLALAVLPATMQAATATSTTTVSITVAADAKISVCGATTTLSTAGAFADYLGNCLITYSIRTTKVGGSGSIVLEATTNWVAGGGGSGPVIPADSFTFTTSGNTGPGTSNNGSINAVLAQQNVITAIGANAHANNASFTSSFDLVNNPSWETDTYTVPIRYTLTSN